MTDVHSKYVEDVGNSFKGYLSRPELRSLVIRCRMGDRRSRDRIINHYYPMIRAIATKWYYNNLLDDSVNLDDVMGCAMLAALEALTKIEPGRLEDSSNQLAFYLIRSIRSRLLNMRSREYNDPEVYILSQYDDNDDESFGIRKTLGDGIMYLSFSILSIRGDVTNGLAVDTLRMKVVLECMRQLPNPDKEVVARRHGIGYDAPHKMSDIARDFRSGSSTMYFIYNRGVKTLRELCQKRLKGMEAVVR